MKCLSCNKIIGCLKKPFSNNFKGAVDILLYPHYGSIHSLEIDVTGRQNSLNVTPTRAVICDGCYSDYQKNSTK